MTSWLEVSVRVRVWKEATTCKFLAGEYFIYDIVWSIEYPGLSVSLESKFVTVIVTENYIRSREWSKLLRNKEGLFQCSQMKNVTALNNFMRGEVRKVSKWSVWEIPPLLCLLFPCFLSHSFLIWYAPTFNLQTTLSHLNFLNFLLIYINYLKFSGYFCFSTVLSFSISAFNKIGHSTFSNLTSFFLFPQLFAYLLLPTLFTYLSFHYGTYSTFFCLRFWNLFPFLYLNSLQHSWLHTNLSNQVPSIEVTNVEKGN